MRSLLNRCGMVQTSRSEMTGGQVVIERVRLRGGCRDSWPTEGPYPGKLNRQAELGGRAACMTFTISHRQWPRLSPFEECSACRRNGAVVLERQRDVVSRTTAQTVARRANDVPEANLGIPCVSHPVGPFDAVFAFRTCWSGPVTIPIEQDQSRPGDARQCPPRPIAPEASDSAAPGRECGACTLCCKVYALPELCEAAGRFGASIAHPEKVGCDYSRLLPTSAGSFSAYG